DGYYADTNNNLPFTLDGLNGLRINGHAADTLIVDNTAAFTLPAGVTVNPQTFTASGDPAEGGVLALQYSFTSGTSGFGLGLSPFTYFGIGNLEIDGGMVGETFQVGDGINSLDWLPPNLSISIQGMGGDKLVVND